MRMVFAFVVLLAAQANSSLTPGQIIERAAKRSVQDRKHLVDYQFDVRLHGVVGVFKDGSPNKLPSINELFGDDRYTYQWTASSMASIDDRLVYAIDFSPKPKSFLAQLFSKPRTQVLNSLHGNIYIDREDLAVVRLNVWMENLPSTVKAIGKIYQLRAEFEQIKVDSFWFPKKVTSISEYSILGGEHVPESTNTEFENYHPKAP